MQNFYILTGGPGAGKTSLLNRLQQLGFACSEEAGRHIIQDQVSIGGKALPWEDRALFAEAMLIWEMRNYAWAKDLTHDVQAPAVLFDRGIPDILGYLTLCGLPVPDHLQRAAKQFRYHQRVFILPYWDEIFSQDCERKQTPLEAAQTYHAMVTTYSALGYQLIEVPKLSIAQRTDFILSQINT